MGVAHKGNSTYIIKNRNVEEIMNEIDVHFTFQKQKILNILRKSFFN